MNELTDFRDWARHQADVLEEQINRLERDRLLWLAQADAIDAHLGRTTPDEHDTAGSDLLEDLFGVRP